MQRHEVNQEILSLYERPAYLEIGVDQGVTFRAIEAARKVAVDVQFAFDWKLAAVRPENAHCTYKEMSSDEYFFKDRNDEMFDVIFIDGLHTYEQTLRDLMNACCSLKRSGAIIIDDVFPTSYAASLPDLEFSRKFWKATNNPDGSWMGDVFRLVFFIEAFMPSFSYFTVAENHGQLIMWQEPRSEFPKRSIEYTAKMHYADAVMNADTFHVKPLAEIKADIARWHDTRGVN